MDKDVRHTLTLYVAAPGTPLTGSTQRSLSGHVYMETAAGNDRISHGFQPGGAPVGYQRQWHDVAVPGAIVETDTRQYQDPYYSRTIEISKDQFDRIREFAKDPEKYGFSKNYETFTNSCTDFVWASLKHAGIHDSKVLGVIDFEGDIKPIYNVKPIQMIKPPFPDSDLNKEHFNEMPTQNWREKIFSENDAPTLSPDRALAAAGADVSHRNDPMLAQINQGVAALDAQNGRTFDATSENISASLYALAKANGLTHIDHVLLSNRTAQADAAQNIFIVQGDPGDPAHLRASMATAVAAQTPAETSFERAQELSQAAQARSQDELQQRQVQEQSGPRMG
ncbi:XVIPCD domain-containing protein [Stenotrophomonas sp.]|uniref:XVIPCD domain-containing protein n=1 Tax=Stenotrophomonas sp. TaxID=69392 RepID=UPI00289A4467|nr:XVIPCD domain-containing protein [Stenotrophomonas sp.]